MKLWLKLGIGVLGLGAAAFGGYTFYLNDYVPYVPIVYSEAAGAFVKSPKLNTPKHQSELLKLVRDPYSLVTIKCKIKSGKVWVQRRMYLNEYGLNDLFNLTEEVEDPAKRPHVKVLPPQKIDPVQHLQAVEPEKD